MRSELYIGGKWVNARSNEKIDVINPATGEVFHRIAQGNKDDADAAVKAARQAFDSGVWSKLPGKERAVYLRRIASNIRFRLEEIAHLEVLDNGKPYNEAIWDITDAAFCFDYYAGLAEELDESSITEVAVSDARFISKAVKEPVGVVGAIVPWNYPLLMAAWKVAPALAAGCTVVLKPSEVTSLTTLELAEIAITSELPGGVLNIVTGFGKDLGQAIVEHPEVNKLAFTGSAAVGSMIMAEAARDIKRVSLELGGKSPFLIFEDADIEEAVEWIMFGIFWNQGQVCSATSRVLIHDKIYEQVINRLIIEAQKITIGDGLQEGILLGPLVSDAQHKKVIAAVDKAKSDGALVLTGGKQPDHLQQGFFFEPTILANVDLNSDAWKEEIFGPVVCVHPFSTEEEALRLANDSRYGLAAAVMTKDVERAERVSSRLKAGIIWINCSQPTFTEAPWGGYKQSGIGRELGKWGFENYLETKQVTTYTSPDPWGWYIK